MKTLPILAVLLLVACSTETGTTSEGQAGAPTAPATRSAPAATGTTPTAVEMPPPEADDRAAAPKVAVDGEGLRLVDPRSGSSRPLAFGMPQADLLAALAFRGAPGTGANAECGNTRYANWPDGLSLLFEVGRFAGWALDGRTRGALTTMSGVGPGTTRASLDDAYGAEVRQTTLGSEFTAGELTGLLDGPGQKATITNMWAGLTCIAR